MAVILTNLPVLLAIAALGLYVIHIVSEQRRMKGAKHPPGPKGWPIVGNAPDMAAAKGNVLPLFARWAKQFGPIAEFSILGKKQVVLSTDKIAQDLFVKRGNIYSGRGIPHAMRYVTRDISPALMPKNDAWRRERKLIHTTMNLTANTKYQTFMAEEAALMISSLLKTPADFDAHFARYSYAVLTRSVFGFRVSDAKDPFVVHQEKFIEETMKLFRPDEYPSNIFPFLGWLPSWTLPSLAKMKRLRAGMDEEVHYLRRRVEKQIAEEQAGTTKKASKWDSIYRHFLTNRDQYEVTDQEAGFTFQAMLGAGTRSPHNALLTFACLMMEYPEWQEKLQKEIDTVVGAERLPTFADVPNLPTVRAIVKEGIRYRSIKAELGIPHRLDEDDVYEGYFFPKGTVFFANSGGILMEKETYPDQEVFNPARWLDPSFPTYREPLTEYPNCRGFAAFGYGRRACPGLDFAERTLVIMVAYLAWACNIKKPIDEETGKPVVLDIKYQPVPNPAPLPFPCLIEGRGEKRREVVEREARRLMEEE